MYEYISGYIEQLTPTNVIIDNQGIGYDIKISLNTYSQLEGVKESKLFLHFVVREDAQIFYGFFDKDERELFRLLISVNGVGANTAQMMLSSLSASEIENAILSSDVGTLQSIKGIGAKSAQRIILDLKDKIGKSSDDDFKRLLELDNSVHQEAEAALLSLGFNKKQISKSFKKISKPETDLTVEEMIKQALKQM
jgi:Holliday junction DNA helicase RuvA